MHIRSDENQGGDLSYILTHPVDKLPATLFVLIIADSGEKADTAIAIIDSVGALHDLWMMNQQVHKKYPTICHHETKILSHRCRPYIRCFCISDAYT